MSASPPGGAGGMMGGDPGADMGADPGADSSNVVCTICQAADGTFMVYAGDEPDPGADAGMSADDADAMGPAGGAPAPGGDAGAPPDGQPADSVGAALKIAMSILQSSDGGPGGADSQFEAGFGGSKSPTLAQKY